MVVAQRRQLESENYVAELRGRVAKLSERNTASEVSTAPESPAWELTVADLHTHP
jgi:hypothetical protein